MHLDFLYDLIGQYGLYAVLILVMIEGDITLLIAGVLAHSSFFGEYSFARVLIWGTLGGCASDNLAYFAGRAFCEGVREVRFYRAAKPRLERLTNKFGPLSIFLSKYIYGLRWAACVFYGVGRMPYLRFLLLSFASCFLWVFILAGAGYFFSGAVMGLIGDFQRLGKVLLVIVVLGIVAFYLVERFWLSPKVEEADPERLQELEHAASERFHDLREEIQEHIPLKRHRGEHKERKSDGD
ncbi:MAG TPA: DedA family protein [Pyrinomonadaceae bacterium]|nr:DedA family protein [Pyrinomonadaceae bacterium]